MKYFAAWFGMMVLAIANGACRDFWYSAYVGNHTAHQISTGTLLALLAGYMLLLTMKWPFVSAKQAWTIGTMWFVMTEAFEIGMGLRAVVGRNAPGVQCRCRAALDIYTALGTGRTVRVPPVQAKMISCASLDIPFEHLTKFCAGRRSTMELVTS